MYKTNIYFDFNIENQSIQFKAAIMIYTIATDKNNRGNSNRKIAEARKNKSLKLIQEAVSILKMQQVKPTITQVLFLLKGQLGETTIKKYWRVVNPKVKSNNEAEIDKAGTKNNLKETYHKSGEPLLELYIKEWDFKIYNPKYFQIMYKVNQELANVYYQEQFNQTSCIFRSPF